MATACPPLSHYLRRHDEKSLTVAGVAVLVVISYYVCFGLLMYCFGCWMCVLLSFG